MIWKESFMDGLIFNLTCNDTTWKKVVERQEERNRVAETLDADVKRWSSGKEGKWRALLSTL